MATQIDSSGCMISEIPSRRQAVAAPDPIDCPEQGDKTRAGHDMYIGSPVPRSRKSLAQHVRVATSSSAGQQGQAADEGHDD